MWREVVLSRSRALDAGVVVGAEVVGAMSVPLVGAAVGADVAVWCRCLVVGGAGLARRGYDVGRHEAGIVSARSLPSRATGVVSTQRHSTWRGIEHAAIFAEGRKRVQA